MITIKRRAMAGVFLATTLYSMQSMAVLLDIGASWTADDFSTGILPSSNGEVFGVAPSVGSTTVHLDVNTDSFYMFPSGYTYNHLGVDYTLSHDFYGYTDVQLVGGIYSFGSATWNSEGILDYLEGPDELEAALWSNTDITSSDPSLVSFRMFGSGDGITADLFAGSRTPSTINNDFTLWEYYQGDEIRVDGYTVSRPNASIPEPTTLALIAAGLFGLGVTRRRKKIKSV